MRSITTDPTTTPHLDPDVRRFLDRLAVSGGPPIHTLAPDAARAVLQSAQEGPVAVPPTTVEDRTISGGPTGQVQLRIVRPAGVTGTLPAVVYLHGGGWILGGKDTHDRLVRQLAAGARAAVVFVDYLRSPEARYPVAIEQAYATTLWVTEEGPAEGLDPSRLILAGDSVGGNMVAAVTLMARERGGPRAALQVLAYPVTDAAMDTGSYHEFADGPWLTAAGMRWFWDAYAPDPSMRAEPTASPLRAPLEALQDLPPALVRC